MPRDFGTELDMFERQARSVKWVPPSFTSQVRVRNDICRMNKMPSMLESNSLFF